MDESARGLGRIAVLNGAPRSGKSSIAAELQRIGDGLWITLGVDLSMKATPPRLQPGIGLRPGGERPDLEDDVARLFAALYESIAAHSRLGFDVAVDIGHHDDYSRPLGILRSCARRISGLPALLIGVRCPLETILRRRRETGWNSELRSGDPPPPPVLRWQRAVHEPGIYDMELDTSLLTAMQCAEAILRRFETGSAGAAFERIAAGDD